MRGIASSGTEGLFWTRRDHRGDHRSRREPRAHRSDWCWRHWQDIDSPDSSASPSHQATIWREPLLRPLRPVPRDTHPFPQSAIQGHRCGHQESRGFDTAASVPVLERDTGSPGQCGIHPRPTWSEREGDIYSGGGAEPIGHHITLHHIPDLHYPSGLCDSGRSDVVDGVRL